uniref:Uncharacterized protein n=1 Tax=Aureoumbra lagunensis TaxID=44058 RepID=A0A7S3NJU5_9STRA|mmetsp:Transcript_11698/g.15884  ORF Transcript_11698/g.15884 Transcript_11698/m.15884 type:complete len:233 (-) Transcript_11698:34-732(-)
MLRFSFLFFWMTRILCDLNETIYWNPADCPEATFPFLLWLAPVDEWNERDITYNIYDVNALPQQEICSGPLPIVLNVSFPVGTFGQFNNFKTGTDPPFDAAIETASFQCFPHNGTFRIDINATDTLHDLHWTLSFYSSSNENFPFESLDPPVQFIGSTPAETVQRVCFELSGTTTEPSISESTCPNTGNECDEDSECGSNCCIPQTKQRNLRHLLYGLPTPTFCGNASDCVE